MLIDQSHLDLQDTVNYGSYYTPKGIVDTACQMLSEHIGSLQGYKIIDTSCGYGSFLTIPQAIGADIDAQSLEIAKKQHPHAIFFCHNSLKGVSRAQYHLKSEDKLIIVGNPPYSDAASLVKRAVKQSPFAVDIDIKARDLGISFLRSYHKLGADFICVLHPLSYLIKKSNFASLKSFKDNYRLKDGLIISSHEFSATSKTTAFPIIIALYEKIPLGMDYDFIRTYPFKTKEGKTWSLNQFDEISNYIGKYPNQKSLPLEGTAAFFWTMRDINALKRARSFVPAESPQTIRVPIEKIAYYCYIDIFKDYLKHIPYYFGNNEVMIDNKAFLQIKDAFLCLSLKKHNFLAHIKKPDISEQESRLLVDAYFKRLCSFLS